MLSNDMTGGREISQQGEHSLENLPPEGGVPTGEQGAEEALRKVVTEEMSKPSFLNLETVLSEQGFNSGTVIHRPTRYRGKDKDKKISSPYRGNAGEHGISDLTLGQIRDMMKQPDFIMKYGSEMKTYWAWLNNRTLRKPPLIDQSKEDSDSIDEQEKVQAVLKEVTKMMEIIRIKELILEGGVSETDDSHFNEVREILEIFNYYDDIAKHYQLIDYLFLANDNFEKAIFFIDKSLDIVKDEMKRKVQGYGSPEYVKDVEKMRARIEKQIKVNNKDTLKGKDRQTN